jgi:uncharacterized membrane protein YcgQ (UPF0703/DUF1980 family)
MLDMMNSMQNRKSKIPNWLLPWLDVLAIASWGILMLRYWLTGKLYLLIHPGYFWLVITGGLGLLLVSGLKAWDLLRRRRTKVANTGHITLFPPGFSSALLLTTAYCGAIIHSPRVCESNCPATRCD